MQGVFLLFSSSVYFINLHPYGYFILFIYPVRPSSLSTVILFINLPDVYIYLYMTYSICPHVYFFFFCSFKPIILSPLPPLRDRIIFSFVNPLSVSHVS